MVIDFPNVFPNELPGLPPEREIDFAIDLVLLTIFISLLQYRMVPVKLRELKIQLQELVDIFFFPPSILPWGAPIFVN